MLDHGADPTIVTENGETPLNLASNPDIRELLGGDMNGTANESTLPITPNYIKNPPLNTKEDYSHWGNGSLHRRQPPTQDTVEG